jgi:hypothetical protein
MKKNLKVYPFLIGLCLLIFCSCKKEINFAENRSLIASDLIKYKDFISYYENTLQDLRKKGVDKSTMDAQFTALDIVPEWSKAKTHISSSGQNYLEVPAKLYGNGTLVASPDRSSTKFNAQSDILVPIRLIITKIDETTFESNIMVLKSDLPYSNGVVPDFDLERKIDNFTGKEYLFNLNGSFAKGWVHK